MMFGDVKSLDIVSPMHLSVGPWTIDLSNTLSVGVSVSSDKAYGMLEDQGPAALLIQSYLSNSALNADGHMGGYGATFEGL